MSLRPVFTDRGSHVFSLVLTSELLSVLSLEIYLLCVAEQFVLSFEPRKKTGLWGLRPGPTQTGLYSHRR